MLSTRTCTKDYEGSVSFLKDVFNACNIYTVYIFK